MKVILFGASGMVGQGVLRECLRDDGVSEVLVVGRTASGATHAKVRELVHADFLDWSAVEERLAGYDACFFCLGVSAAGMTAAEYTMVTHDYTLAVAEVLARRSPGSTFIYVSGQGTDVKGRSMWARVKGRTEEDLRALPLKAVMFRPGLIRPMHGIRSKTRLYRATYLALWPVSPLLAAAGAMTTTERVGKAMLAVARGGAPRPHLGNRDIDALAKRALV